MKIATAKSRELVADHLLQQIKTGERQPGDRLPSVVEMAEAYGVGRSTIREAVSALKATGWLDVRHGGGTFVSKSLPTEPKNAADLLFRDAGSLIELLEVRQALEVGAASLAAARRNAQHLERLRELLVVMERSLDGNDTAEGERADVAFHREIVNASGNPLFVRLTESLADRFAATIRQTRELWFYRENATAARLLEEHRSLYEAIERQDDGLAASLVAAHLDKVIGVLRVALDE
ncbi:FadR/GntR family transcriptional regulator [Cohnella sp. GCM10027633]|uniref:FadR/GntR family transcriptional regulator n=1 Tax=unclassified Cohnella TaxID=2636738 RepID=UPI003636F30A